MPETKTQPRPAAKKAAPSGAHRATRTQPDRTRAVERPTELTEDVIKSLEQGAQSAIEAVRKFVGVVDEALPAHGEGPSRSKEITDSALEMAGRLVHTQSEFLLKVVDSAGKSLTKSDDAK